MPIDSDLIACVARTGSFPQLRGALTQWRASRPVDVVAEQSALVVADPRSDETMLMAGALLLGSCLSRPAARAMLTGPYADVENWRVQECLAKSVDEYCHLDEWRSSLEWLAELIAHPKANVRRAALEGPRIWTRRPPFVGQPEQAIGFIKGPRTDQSSYVRKSLGNALSDIGKDAPDLVLAEVSAWAAAADVHREVARHALRHFLRAKNPAPKRSLRT